MGLSETLNFYREEGGDDLLDPESQPLLPSRDIYILPSVSVKDKERDMKKKKKWKLPRFPEWMSIGLILSNLIIGIGLLNFPAAYRDSGGIVPAVSLQTVCVVFVVVGMFQIVRAQEACGAATYQETVRQYLGPVGLLICDVLIVVHNLGTCAILLVILADQMDSVILYVHGPGFCKHWYLDRRFTTTIISCLLILPACFPKNIHTFKYTSVIGVITTAYILWLVIWKYGQRPEGSPAKPAALIPDPETSQWTDIFKVLPTICFSFEGHIEAVPLFAGCREKTNARRTFKLGVILCMTICVVTYTLTGVFGYMTFGDDVRSDVLTSYLPIDVYIIVATAIMAVKVVTSYPVILYCARIVVEELFGKDPLMMKTGDLDPGGVCASPWWTETRRRSLATVVLFSLTLALAVSVPSIGSVIPLLGGTGALFIFIFPGLCYMKHHAEVGNTWSAYSGAGLAVLGAFIGGVTTTQSVYRYLAGEFSTTEIPCMEAELLTN